MPTHERTAKARRKVLQHAMDHAYTHVLELVNTCFNEEPTLDRLELGLHVTKEQELGVRVAPFERGRPSVGGEGVSTLKVALRGRHKPLAVMLLDFKVPRVFHRQERR